MDLNIKSLDDDVVRRLAEQASAEGLSRQEWLRRILTAKASTLSPAEFAANRLRSDPSMTREEFLAVESEVARRSARRNDRHPVDERRREVS